MSELPPHSAPLCAFCSALAPVSLQLARFGATACVACATRLGRLLVSSPEVLVPIWPLLVDAEDDLEPEPQVRRADGTVVELRQATAELKRELDLEARMQLAVMYGELGMHREQIQEAGHVLGEAHSPQLAQRAVDLLFSEALCSPSAIAQLRGRLFPA
jgi:hypothetical protein